MTRAGRAIGVRRRCALAAPLPSAPGIGWRRHRGVRAGATELDHRPNEPKGPASPRDRPPLAPGPVSPPASKSSVRRRRALAATERRNERIGGADTAAGPPELEPRASSRPASILDQTRIAARADRCFEHLFVCEPRGAPVLTAIAASHIPPWLPSGSGRLGRRLSRV